MYHFLVYLSSTQDQQCFSASFRYGLIPPVVASTFKRLYHKTELPGLNNCPAKRYLLKFMIFGIFPLLKITFLFILTLKKPFGNLFINKLYLSRRSGAVFFCFAVLFAVAETPSRCYDWKEREGAAEWPMFWMPIKSL